ncbi:MAG: polysaccharide biosynthesis C-terminal domain-containing protein [Saprospiraceae bacterium]
MKREFLLNILFLVFINLLIKPFFIFGIDLTVQNRAPEGDYGLYFTLLNFTYIFQIVNDFGIQNFNNRTLSQHPQLLPKYFPNLLFLKFWLSLGYFALTMLAAGGAGYGRRELGLLGILLVNQILAQGILFLRSNLSGLGFFRVDSVLSSLDKLLMLGTCGLLLWANPLPGSPFSVEWFALAQTLALAATALVAFFILRSRADFPIRPSWAGNWRAGRATLGVLFRKSFPFALVILLMSAYSRLDAVMLERLLPDGKLHADVFAGGYRLLDAANMLGYLFATLLLPMFAQMLGGRRTADGGRPMSKPSTVYRPPSAVRELISLSFKLIWAGSITLAATVWFARHDLVVLMMPARASVYRADVLGLLIWAFVPVSTTYIFSTLLTANESLMQMNRFFVVGLVLDVALNLSLVPHFQAIGSACAVLGTQTFIAGAMVWLSVRTFGLRPSRGGLWQVLGFAAWSLAADFWLFENTGLDWKWKFALALAVGLAGLFLFKVFNIKQIRRVLKR